MEDDVLAERVASLERALTDRDADGDRPSTGTDDALAERVDALESELADLGAAVQAIRGYVGEIRHVNREVERTAEAALAAATDEESGPLCAPTGERISETPADGDCDPDDPVDGESATGPSVR